MESRDKLLSAIIIIIYLAVLILLGGTGMNLISLSEKGTEDTRLIGASYMTMNNEFYDILNEQIRVRVEGEGDQIILRDPGLDVERQVEQINSMLAMGISALVVTPVAADGLDDVLDRAKQLGVKVIVVDTELEREGLADCTIVSDNFRAGYMIGKYMMSRRETGRILILHHDTALSASRRVEGFKAALKNNMNYDVVKEIDCKGQYEIALPLIEQYIEEGGEFDAIFCLNDLAGEAAVTALRNHPELGSVSVYGVDGSPDAKMMIRSGDMDATAAQFPTEIGDKAADILYRMLDGEEYPEMITVPVSLVCYDNLEEFNINRWQ